MIINNSKQYSTLDDEIYYQGRKVTKAYFGSALVYPATGISYDDIIDAGGGNTSQDLLFRVSVFWNTKNPATNIITGKGAKKAGSDMDSYLHIFDLNMKSSYLLSGYSTRTYRFSGWGDSPGYSKDGLYYKLDVDNTTGLAEYNYGKRDENDPSIVVEKGKYPVENHIVSENTSKTLPDGYYVIYPTSYSPTGTIGNYFVNVVWKVWDNPEKTQSHNLNKSYMYMGDLEGHKAIVMVILRIENGLVTDIIDKGGDIYDFILRYDLGGGDLPLHSSRSIINTRTTIIYDVTESPESTEFTT